MTQPRLLAIRPALLAALAAGSLGACASHGPAPAFSDARNPLDQYPMAAVRAPDEIALGVHRGGLSPQQRAALVELAGRWREAGGGAVTIRCPADGPDAAEAGRLSRDAADALVALGVPFRAIRLVGYNAGRPGAPVLAGYLRYSAEVSDCSGLWENLTSTGGNRARANFGCTVHADMAAQVANPRDIADPNPIDPSDAGRRAVVLGKYRAGELTSSARDDQAKGTLSTAVPN